MSDTKRTELPEMSAYLLGMGKFVVAGGPTIYSLNQDQALEALRRINAYPADREAVRALSASLERALNASKDDLTWHRSAKDALKLASALGVGE